MKTKILLLIFLCSLLCVSTISHTITTVGSNSQNIITLQDTSKTLSSSQIVTMVLKTDSLEVDTVKKAIFKKRIEPIQIDSLRALRKDSSYQKLEKQQNTFGIQNQNIDSIIIVRKHTL